MEDRLLELLALFLLVRGVAAFFLLAVIGIGYLVYHFRSHIVRGLKVYAGFLSWAFNAEEIQLGSWRVLVYMWFIGIIALFLMDLINPGSGLPMTGSRFVLSMFSITAIAVILDHRNYFRNHSQKPA